MSALSITVDGLRLPNPFLIGSGPPSTNANVIAKALDEGWGGVVAKTICLDASKIINVSPRYARLRDSKSRQVYGWENIELISDRPFDLWLQEFRELKHCYPDRIVIASIMEEYRRDAWHEVVERTQATGVDGLELNFSCPHGLPERKMGSAMGQDACILEEVTSWVKQVAKVPVWAKMTPNVTHIDDMASAALRGGCTGISAINTILCVMGIDLETLRPLPTVEGYSTPGGYSSRAVQPVALRMCMELAQRIRSEFPKASLSGLGGIESGEDAAQFLLLGCNTVQVCTGVMKAGYGLIHQLKAGLEAFMQRHGFQSVEEFRGRSLGYFTTHAELVRLQAQARAKGGSGTRDDFWHAERFVEQAQSLTSGQ